MNVGQIMTAHPQTCRGGDPMTRAAQIMWEADCGCVPVVDDDGKPVGIITDRDICMAAYTRGLALSAMEVTSAAASRIIWVRESDAVATAEQLMREYRVRRLPVVDANGRVVGVVSVNDLARRAHDGRPGGGLSSEGVVKTLAAICVPSPPNAPVH